MGGVEPRPYKVVRMVVCDTGRRGRRPLRTISAIKKDGLHRPFDL